jgi:hypothetical protein
MRASCYFLCGDNAGANGLVQIYKLLLDTKDAEF